MNNEIRTRVSTLLSGHIPNNYKKYEFDVVPNEWNIKKIGEIFDDLKTGATPSRSVKQYFEGDIPWITSGELKDKFIYKTKEYITNSAVQDTNLQKYEKGTLFIAITGLEAQGIRGTCAINAVEATTNQSCLAFREKKEIKNEFLYYWYLLYGEYIGIKYTQGTKQQSLNNKLVERFEIPVPRLQEQNKIVEIISQWDKAIALKEKLIQEKQKQKKGLMERLLTGKVRLNGFNEPFNKVRLDKIIEESKEKSTENNQYEILSVTKEGIFLQREYFNRQIASEDNSGYKVVRKNNLVFSTMNLWMGSIDVLDNYEVGIVSPACKVFYLNYKLVDVSFMKYFVKSSYMMNLYGLNSEQGASVVRRNLDLKGLLSTKIRLPILEEQKKIGKILDISSKEIKLLQKELELLQEQKKGLMQLLLTGIVRVKCD